MPGGNAKPGRDDPQTPEQWQSAVDAAHGFIMIDSARRYRLITGGPSVNLARCEEILRRGRGMGIQPSPDAVDRLVAQLMSDWRPDHGAAVHSG